MNFTFVTGNMNKVEALSRWLGRELAHQKIDLSEIQSVDMHEVVEAKAREAFRVLQKPVLIEDTSLRFHALGKLPGPFIKWFLQELGTTGCAHVLDGFDDRTATASVIYGMFDGQEMHLFEGHVEGSIADLPRGNGGFGWDPLFIPDGSELTYAEMDAATFEAFSVRKFAVDKLKTYLDKNDL